MKIKTNKNIREGKLRPFLVLSVLNNDEDISENMPKNTGLKLFTKTWPPKRDRDNKNEDNARPLTATLDKPTILDIKLLGKIDMSLVTKEFLNITNLCKFPTTIKKTKRKVKTNVINRPLSLPPPTNKFKLCNKKRNKTSETSEDLDSWEDEESVIHSARKSKQSKINNRLIKQSDNDVPNNKIDVKKFLNGSDANNNNKTFKIPRKRLVNSNKLLNVKSDIINKSTKLPEPCKTCGRPNQPERFHSHPSTPQKPMKKMEDSPKIPVKSTVQKPVAIKYKSKQSSEKKPPPLLKTTLPAQKTAILAPTTAGKGDPPSRGGSAKRTLTCYICGREFGTASLHLHEPKCLEKWKRENSNLPNHLRRKIPVKPDHDLTREEWDMFAWDSSQANLIPCQNCGRTFYPDRLLVHQRSCKEPSINPSLVPCNSCGRTFYPDRLIIHQKSCKGPSINLKTMESVTNSNHEPNIGTSENYSLAMPPPSENCYICGRKFGKQSINIHEKQCLKKWHTENNLLPPDMRAAEPTRNPTQKTLRTPDTNKSNPTNEETQERPSSSAKPKSPLFPCYICGRLYTVNSIYIHEPQCLKQWKIENDKLPPNKRRPQPLKPDIKFTRSGKIDIQATNEANWQSHLSQLVPCKFCTRTFNPDRVEVHERSCKG